MTATGHAIVGAAIAAKIPDPLIALPLALASHFLCDALPHWDTNVYWRTKGKRRAFFEAILDVLGGYVIVFLFFIQLLKFDPGQIYLGVLFSQLPDFLEVPYFFWNWRFPPFNWVDRIQHIFHRKLALPWGLVNQVVVAAVVVVWSVS